MPKSNNPESEKSQDSDSWFNYIKNTLQYAIPFNLYINNIINNASTFYIKKNNEIKFSKKDIVCPHQPMSGLKQK
jgi:hypothetical protein